MEVILQIANSTPFWVIAAAVIGIVLVQSILFARLAFKNAAAVGITHEQCWESIKIGMITSIGPSFANFIVVISMMVLVGGPVTWMRMSMIGSSQTALTACTLGAEACGSTFGGEGYDLTAMASAWWTMAVNGAGWIVAAAILAPRLETVRRKMGGGDSRWTALITSSAMLGLFGYLISPYLLDFGGINQIVALASVIAMACLMFLSKKAGTWLKEWALGFTIIVGVTVGILLS